MTTTITTDILYCTLLVDIIAISKERATDSPKKCDSNAQKANKIKILYIIIYAVSPTANNNNCSYHNCDDHIFTSFVHPQFT